MKNDFQKLFEEANELGRAWAISIHGSDVMILPCGFAWVVVRPNNSSFAKWLKDNRKGSYDSHREGVVIWIHDHNQSADHKATHAVKMAQYLQINGIDCEAGTRLD